MQKAFIEDLELVRGLSQNTIKSYTNWLNTILLFVGVPLEKITLNIIDSFISNRRKIGASPKTINLHLIALRSFLKYCNRKDQKTIIPESILPIPVADKELILPEDSEIKKLFEIELPTREKAIIETLFSTGLRISELKKIRIETIKWEEKQIVVIGKGGKLRLVFLSPGAITAIKNHIQDKKTGLVFKESTHTIQRLIKNIARKAGIKSKITPHTLRHIFATDLLKNGADIYDVKMFLGHKSVTTTEKYLHITNESLEEKFKKFHNTKRL